MTGEGWLPGYIQDYDGQALTLVVPFSDSEFLQTHDVTECSVRVEDGRRISAVQRRKIYALLRDIADWTGYEPQELKELMKYDFLSQCEDGTQYFSLSDADMTTARNFITYLIEFCVVHAVPCNVSLLSQCEDMSDIYIPVLLTDAVQSAERKRTFTRWSVSAWAEIAGRCITKASWFSRCAGSIMWKWISSDKRASIKNTTCRGFGWMPHSARF